MTAAHEAARFMWGPGDWIAFGMLVVAIIGMIGAGAAVVWRTSHRFGEHHQRLVTAEREIKALKEADGKAETDRAELAVLTALMTRVETAMRDMSHDLNRRMETIEADIRRYLGRREGER